MADEGGVRRFLRVVLAVVVVLAVLIVVSDMLKRR
jgi:hypothetical protein